MERFQFVQLGSVQARYELAKGHRIIERESISGPQNIMPLLIHLPTHTQDRKIKRLLRRNFLPIRRPRSAVTRLVAIRAAGDVIFLRFKRGDSVISPSCSSVCVRFRLLRNANRMAQLPNQRHLLNRSPHKLHVHDLPTDEMTENLRSNTRRQSQQRRSEIVLLGPVTDDQSACVEC